MEIPGNELRIKREQMKVDSKKTAGKGHAAKTGATGGDEADTTEISSEAAALETAIQSVLSSPELSRPEKVAQIKKGLEDGTLKFNSRDVAEKILQNLIAESHTIG